MNDRDGQPKDYEARERRTMRFNIGICVAFLVILIGVDIGVIFLGGPVKEIVLGIVFTLIIGAVTGLLIVYYIKKFVSPNISDTDVDSQDGTGKEYITDGKYKYATDTISDFFHSITGCQERRSCHTGNHSQTEKSIPHGEPPFSLKLQGFMVAV